VVFCPLQNIGFLNGAHLIAAEYHSRPTGSQITDSRCFVEDNRPLCQLSPTRSEDNWHSGLLSSKRRTRAPTCASFFSCHQGAEGQLVKNSIEALEAKVYRLIIGTHSAELHHKLTEFLKRREWIPIWDVPFSPDQVSAVEDDCVCVFFVGPLGGHPLVGRYKIFVQSNELSCTRQSSFYCPSICIAHILAIRLHYYCAIYDPHLTPLVYAIHHTILAVAISCKGQSPRPSPLCGSPVDGALLSGVSSSCDMSTLSLDVPYLGMYPGMRVCTLRQRVCSPYPGPRVWWNVHLKNTKTKL